MELGLNTTLLTLNPFLGGGGAGGKDPRGKAQMPAVLEKGFLDGGMDRAWRPSWRVLLLAHTEHLPYGDRLGSCGP